MEMFKKGETIALSGGKSVKVVKVLGNGGQGVVYDVTMDGKHYALKWYLRDYLKHIAQKKFYDNLVENIKAQAPSSDFLWPIAISEFRENSFGYLMDIRPKRYCDFSLILNAKQKFRNVKTQITAAKNICKAFQALHKNGYGYQDINNGNFFVDIQTGDVLICDNDNVAPCGMWMGMAGKDRYMAPEIVLGKKHAGMESDLFSLAVILFMVFFIAHPLEGKAVHACPCLTAKYMRYFYAENPVFVYDPVNASNRPVKGIDNNVINLWKLYPESLQQLFTRSFTQGLFHESYRVRENEWIDCFNEMENSLFDCPYCGGEQFYYPEEDGKQVFRCEDCKTTLRKPFLLEYKRRRKILYLGTKIKSSDIANGQSDELLGEVVESEKHPGLWGIRLKKDIFWEAKYTNGFTKSGNKENVIPLFVDTELTIERETVKIII